MDQRVDNERRLETTPGREAKPAVGAARPARSWLDRLRARRRSVLIITALIIAAIAATVYWWVNSVTYESTDDAFIDARTVPISAQISAAIVDVPVTDNELVEAGAVLVRLDDRDFRAQVDQAKAQVAQAQASIANVEAQVTAQQARIEQAEKQTAQAQAALTFAKQEDERYQRLVKTGAVMVVRDRLVSACSRVARACSTCASAWVRCACRTGSCMRVALSLRSAAAKLAWACR